jgi:hypothetical protein
MKRPGERFFYPRRRQHNPKSMEIILGDRISRHERHAWMFSADLYQSPGAKLTFPKSRIKNKGDAGAQVNGNPTSGWSMMHV